MSDKRGGNGAPGKEPGPYVPVTDADRIEAARLGEKYAGWSPRQVEMTLAGDADEYPFVQSLARHAMAAAQAAIVATTFVSPGIPVYKTGKGETEVFEKGD